MISLEQARELLRRAVETQGRDFIYNPGANGGCYYIPNPDALEPKNLTGCLVGVALDLANEDRHHTLDDVSVRELADEFSDMMTEEASRYFTTAQVNQDDGATWGEAFDAAEMVAMRKILR